MSPITGKTVVVCGSSRGIGLALVRLFLQKGNRVVAGARSPANSPGLAQLAKDHAANLTTAQVDVTEPPTIAQFASTIAQQHPTVDILVNCAGVQTKLRSLDEHT